MRARRAWRAPRSGRAVALAAGLLALACAGPRAEEPKVGAFDAEATTVAATVQGIRPEERTVLLRRDDGGTLAMRLGADVRNADRLARGERVVATYLEPLAVYLSEEEGAPGVTPGTKVFLQPRGGKRGPVSANLVEITARVQGVDATKRTLTLMGEAGVIGSFRVDPSVRAFDDVEPGDDVVARITEATAIEVKSP